VNTHLAGRPKAPASRALPTKVLDGLSGYAPLGWAYIAANSIAHPRDASPRACALRILFSREHFWHRVLRPIWCPPSRRSGRAKGAVVSEHLRDLALSTVAIDLLGFMFWLLNARLSAAGRIGEATSFISGDLADLPREPARLQQHVRSIPADSGRSQRAHQRRADTVRGAAAVVVATESVLGLPMLAQKLDFIRQNAWYAIGFVVPCRLEHPVLTDRRLPRQMR
jgi:hypothetical protein